MIEDANDQMLEVFSDNSYVRGSKGEMPKIVPLLRKELK